MKNYDIVSFKDKIKPLHAEGRFCINLTDPLTGKIKEQYRSKNTIISDALFNTYWTSNISRCYLELTDCADDITPNCPYMIGNTVGYGIPSTDGTGRYRGAYNAANQVLAQMSLEKVHWKFQYDFTTAQANGVAINRIGLTPQYIQAATNINTRRFATGLRTTAYKDKTSDGRYIYSCSSGVITKIDGYLAGAATTIDVSAITGTSGTFNIGYNQNDGLYYVVVYSSTASSRKVYVFTDDTFSTNTAAYTCTNMQSAFNSSYPISGYGNCIFIPFGTYVYWLDIVNNTWSFITLSTSLSPIWTGSAMYSHSSSCHLCYGKYLFALGDSYGSDYGGFIIDMSTKTEVGIMRAIVSSPAYYIYAVKHPIISNFLPCVCSGTVGELSNNCMIAGKKLGTPVTKTDAYGMTATYEIDVYWE